MKFPNAQAGVKKLFISQILSIVFGVVLFISSVLMLVGVAIGQAGKQAEELAASLGGIGFVGLGLAGAAAILSIVAYIINLVGLRQAGKDADPFRVAFLLTIFQLIFTVVTSIFSALNLSNGIADNISKMIQNILDIAIVLQVITGVMNLAEELEDTSLDSLCRNIGGAIVLSYGLAAVASLIPLLVGKAAITSSLESGLGIAAALFDIFGSICYIIFLKKSIKVLAK